jgi:hypothetical protein
MTQTVEQSGARSGGKNRRNEDDAAAASLLGGAHARQRLGGTRGSSCANSRETRACGSVLDSKKSDSSVRVEREDLDRYTFALPGRDASVDRAVLMKRRASTRRTASSSAGEPVTG